jgi:4'-phosphopantetheinyl transferase
VTLEQNPLPGNLNGRVRRLPSPDPRVEVFWCTLEDDAALATSVAAWLSAEEQARAARFGTDALRRRYVIGRATLRALLGRRLRVPPGAVVLARGRRGRPRLAAAGTLDFNVSHTRGVLLAGIADGITIGVDVEHAARTINTEGIARRCLAPAEQAVMAALDTEGARRDVLQRWTCKEAMSKATGDAMSAPFRRLDLELRDHPVLVAGPPPYVPADWTLRALPVDGYFATLALWSGRPHER